MAHGIFRQLGGGVQAQLAHDIGLVKLDGFYRDVQQSGHLLQGPPLGYQLQHLALAVGQPSTCPGFPAQLVSPGAPQQRRPIPPA